MTREGLLENNRHGNEWMRGVKSLKIPERGWNRMRTYSRRTFREQCPLKTRSLAAVAFGSRAHAPKRQGPDMIREESRACKRNLDSGRQTLRNGNQGRAKARVAAWTIQMVRMIKKRQEKAGSG